MTLMDSSGYWMQKKKKICGLEDSSIGNPQTEMKKGVGGEAFFKKKVSKFQKLLDNLKRHKTIHKFNARMRRKG